MGLERGEWDNRRMEVYGGVVRCNGLYHAIWEGEWMFTDSPWD